MQLYEAESQVFQYHHATIGSKILERWNLPAQLRAGIAMHHYPSNYLARDSRKNRLPLIVKVADMLAYKIRQGDGGNKTHVLAEEFSEEVKPLLSQLSPNQVIEEKQAGIGCSYNSHVSSFLIDSRINK